MKYFLIGLLIFFMYSKIGAYNTTESSFFSFTGKKFSKEKTCTMHYHYDLHGNVKTIIQDNAQISVAGQRYKKIDYEYDLISGKVNAVHYQNNQPDQFHHKYEYDADNRITDVYTSKDKILWDHDAKYFYYPHGPLARIEYGDNHVQGMDFAYTLQGWIKAVNSETLENTSDMGNDGNPATGNPNANFAKDAFGYSLTYFENDYQSIGTSGFLAYKTNSDLLKARNDLFNGNISAMVTTLVPPTLQGNTISYSPLPQGTAYKYDQLNRLIEMQAWQNIDAVNNIWGSGLTYAGMYHNKFTYDGNGNILTQLRKDQSGAAINELTYNRIKDANGKLKQNRLYWVNDAVDKDVFADDIDDQQSGNYAYDELGNLKQNAQKEIAEIKYSVYGKVKEVTRTAGSSKKNLKFDYDATGNRISKHVYSSAGVWEKSEFYTRDVSGNVMSIYKLETDPVLTTASFTQTEKPIYGSSRIGTEKTKVELIGTPPVDITHSVRVLGNKEFEGSNHLGNILTTFSDRKIPIDSDNDGAIDEYWPHVISSTDYYPFGVAMKERSFNSLSARHGFNTQEKVNELGPDHYTAEYWEYDGDLATRENLDLLPNPSISPYAAFNLNPLAFVDFKGDTPTVAESAVMQDFTYNLRNSRFTGPLSSNTKNDVSLIGGWSPNYQISDHKSGFKSALFSRELACGNLEYAYVFAGTEDWTDWKTNFKIYTEEVSQMWSALDNAGQYSNKYEGSELTLIGHSLGGWLASGAAMKTGRPAITINAPGISSLNRTMYSLIKNPIINAYVVEGEALNYSLGNFGLGATGGTPIILKADYSFIYALMAKQRVESHYMSSAISKLQEQGLWKQKGPLPTFNFSLPSLNAYSTGRDATQVR